MKTKTSTQLHSEIRSTQANLRRIRGDIAFKPENKESLLRSLKANTQILNMLRATLQERGHIV